MSLYSEDGGRISFEAWAPI